MSAEVLRDLARAKVAFQLRALETIIGHRDSGRHSKRENERSSVEAEGCQSGPKGIAPPLSGSI